MKNDAWKAAHGTAYNIRNGMRCRSSGRRRLSDRAIRGNCVTKIEVSIALELRSSIVAACNLHGDARTAAPRRIKATALDRPAIVSTVAQVDNDLKIAKRRREFAREHRAVEDICGLALLLLLLLATCKLGKTDKPKLRSSRFSCFMQDECSVRVPEIVPL